MVLHEREESDVNIIASDRADVMNKQRAAIAEKQR
jgi:hypothetical protein